MASYNQGETLQPSAMLNWIVTKLGVIPHMTEWNTASNQYGGSYGSWITLFEETSGGPWLIGIVRVDPVYSSASAKYRLTIDGTVISTSAIWHQPTLTNHFIGMPFGANTASNIPPVFARSSFKVEVYNSTSSARSEYAYMGYSIT